MIWVEASPTAEPSLLPFKKSTGPLSATRMATELSMPSRSQRTARRCPCIQPCISLALKLDSTFSPAPIGLCRHAAVGPVANNKDAATAAKTTASPDCRPIHFALSPSRPPLAHENAARPPPKTASSTTTSFHAPWGGKPRQQDKASEQGTQNGSECVPSIGPAHIEPELARPGDPAAQ